MGPWARGAVGHVGPSGRGMIDSVRIYFPLKQNRGCSSLPDVRSFSSSQRLIYSTLR